MKIWTRAGRVLTRMGRPLIGDRDPCKGACCLPNGDCVEVCQEDCETRNGVFQGVCTTCNDADIDCTEPATYDCVNGVCVKAVGDAGEYASLSDCEMFCGNKPIACVELTDNSTGVTRRNCQQSFDMTGAYDTIDDCRQQCGYLTNVCRPPVQQPQGFFTRGCTKELVNRTDLIVDDCVTTSGTSCCCCSGFRMQAGGLFRTSGQIEARLNNAVVGTFDWSLSGLSGCVKNQDEVTFEISGSMDAGHIIDSVSIEYSVRSSDGTSILFDSIGGLGSAVRNQLPSDRLDISESSEVIFRRCLGENAQVEFQLSIEIRFDGGFASVTLSEGVGRCCECEPFNPPAQIASRLGPGSSMRQWLRDIGGGNVV